MHGFGVPFCEVRIDRDLRTVRVARWVEAFALGKQLNVKTLRSQLHGGIVWGIGMALLEESLIDDRHGRFVNSNLAEYHVPVNADVPRIEIALIDEEDTLVSPLGAKGGGEIGKGRRGDRQRRLSRDRQARPRPPDYARQAALMLTPAPALRA